MGQVSISNSTLTQAADQTYQAVLAWLSPHIGNGVWAQYICAIIAGAILTVETAVTGFFSTVFRAGAALANLMLTGIDDARSQNQDTLNSVAAAAVADVMGVPVSASDLPTQTKGGTNTGAFQALGAKVLGAITSELGGTPSSAPGPGERAAQTFMGRGINFGIMSALIGIVGELESLGFIKSFADIGEDMERAMGFGRLMRLAIQPLIHAKITQPYTQEMNAAYRPHQLSAAEYVVAAMAGRLQDADLSQALAQLGYSDALIAELRTQHRPKLPIHSVDAAIRWGKLTADAGAQLLVSQGMPSDIVQTELDALHLAQADAQEKAYADEILTLAKQRYITTDVFSQLLQRLHMSQEEQQGYLNRLGVWMDSFTKRLSMGDLQYLDERNLITTDIIDTWAAAEGYSPSDAGLLDLMVISKDLEFAAAQKKKAAAAAKAAAKAAGTTPAAGG